MGIFLGILAAIGKILLIILLVIAALIALILFFPVVYRARVVKKDLLTAEGSVRWLFGAVSFKFSFDNGKFDYSLRIFGYPLHKKLQGGKNRKKIKPEPEAEKTKGKEETETEFKPAKKQPTIKPGQRAADMEGDEPKGDASPEEARKPAEYNDGEIKRLEDDEAFAEETKPSVLEKIKLTYADLCDKLNKVRDAFALLDKIMNIIKGILKHIFPRKIKGYIEFGFDDPSATGKLLAVMGALCIPIPKTLKVTPDFQEKCFECDVKLSGRIFIIVLLTEMIRLIMVPEVKELLKNKLPGGGRNKKVRKKHKANIRQGGNNG